MLTRQDYEVVRDEAMVYLRRAGITLTDAEVEAFEVADFGLGRVRELGLQLVTYVNTERCCAKELVLLPRQTCPEHLHPPVGDYHGKEETFRCRLGTVYLYVPGPETVSPQAKVPTDRAACFTVWHQIVLTPGQQYTIPPATPHWFQAGDEGAVVSEFSTKSLDEHDVFTDPAVDRIPKMEE